MSDAIPKFSFTANGADWELDEDGKWRQVEQTEQLKFATAYVSAFITTKETSVFIRGYIQNIDDFQFKVMPTPDYQADGFGLIFDRRNITHLSIYPAKE